ncbi:hypothetical protein [Anaerofustis sp.]|uniref:hypothetical protein n=1 Tax=Anaerofustis sp. TaxID=1872517 RepID=UPI0025B91DE5|nr:hypothetical protein [Anaerofustis sp.]
MKKIKKNPVFAPTQRHGIKNIFIIQILALLKENFKIIMLTILVCVILFSAASCLGKELAYVF